MGVTVNINGLSLVHEASGGIAMATVPDVCKTPSPGGPVPIPYPNVARSSSLAKGTSTVTADNGNMCAIQGSEFSSSNGDEPGTAGGVKSGVNMKEATWLLYSFDVQFEGKGVCRLTDKMQMNHGNTVCLGGEVQPPLTRTHWDMQCVLDILCKEDPELVKELNELKSLKTFDEVYWMDPYYDGTKWTKRKFPGGGYNQKKAQEIGLVTEGSCEDGAVTVKHELIHQKQPDMLSADAEDDAYTKAEQWAIDHKLPSQAPGGYSFRSTGADGKVSTNFPEIQRMVRDYYPVPPQTSGPPPPQVVGKTADGKTILEDPTTGKRTTRAPKQGDSYPGPETTKGEQTLDPKALKCP